MPFDDPRIALILFTIVVAAVFLTTVLHAAAQPPEDEPEDSPMGGPDAPIINILLPNDLLEVTATVEVVHPNGRLIYLHGFGWVSASESGMFRYLAKDDRIRVVLDDNDDASSVVLVRPAPARSESRPSDQRPA